jgi:FtsP/CotA-like multicopper oxidase with cupredoxin domain
MTHYIKLCHFRTELAMPIDRREFLKLGGLATLGGAMPGLLQADDVARDVAAMRPSGPHGHADCTLRIGRSLVELAPDHIVSTRTYNGQFPGPLLRLKQGRPVVVDIFNDTDTPEQLHWHGQFLPAAVDGAAEEDTPYIPACGMRRISFTPGPAGLRFYHTHLRAGADLDLGQYSGMVGPAPMIARSS